MGVEGFGLIGMAVLLLLMFLRLPVGVAMAFVGFVGIYFVSGIDGAIGLLKTTPYSTIASYSFSVIPLFVLMGELAFQGGMTDKLYSSAYKIIGHFKGGLAMATILACGIFAAISGSSLATAGAMGKVAIPDMKKYKYDPSFSAATVAAGGTLGILIPPSVVAVVYGILTETSIGKVLLALFIPGLLLLVMYVITAYIIATVHPEYAPAGPRHSLKERFGAAVSVLPVFFMFSVIIGGIYKGIFTASEAAGVGSFIVLLYGLISRNLTWKKFIKAIQDTGQTTAMTFTLLIGVMVMNYFLAITRVPMMLSDFIGSLGFHPDLVFVGIIILYFVLGMFMDSMSVLTLTLPILFPIVVNLGFDPIWFGVMMVVFIEMSMITPPVGMVLFVVKSIAEDVKMESLFKAIIPYIITILLFTFVIFLFPQIVLWLPSGMGR